MAPLSRRAGLDPNVFQNYISGAPWSDARIERINIRALHEERLVDPNAVIAFDDTGFPKQGLHSPGVGRQYSGTLGRVGNCQVAVAGFYVVPGKTRNHNALRWPLGGRLYLPQDWIEDRARRRAGIPADVHFRTKLELALDILEQARAERVPHRCVTADEAYGNGREFLEALRARREPYVLAASVDSLRLIPESVPVGVPASRGTVRFTRPRYPTDVEAQCPRQVAGTLAARGWKTVAWSKGTKGKLSGRFARKRVRIVEPHGNRRWAHDETGWLLFEDSPQRLKAWICWGLDDATLLELARLAHARGMIEKAFEEMKEELGLDHFEGRKWRGFHHHMTMVFLAYSYLQWMRAAGGDPKNLPNIAEVRAHVALRAFKQQLIGEGWSAREAEEITDRAAPYLVGG